MRIISACVLPHIVSWLTLGYDFQCTIYCRVQTHDTPSHVDPPSTWMLSTVSNRRIPTHGRQCVPSVHFLFRIFHHNSHILTGNITFKAAMNTFNLNTVLDSC